MGTSRVFTHSGDIGDVIYALPTIRALGGGDLLLFHYEGRTSHGMNRAKVEKLRRLFEFQDYIHSFDFSEDFVDTSLNGFRDHHAAGNLADMHLATNGLSWTHRTRAWLHCDDINYNYPVVFMRSPRYHNPNFDWRYILNKYQKQAVFIGTREDHELFKKEVGYVPWLELNDFMEIANVIAGSKLYVGNSTAATAVAEGLKHPKMIVEMCLIHPNSNSFSRVGLLEAWNTRIELPTI